MDEERLKDLERFYSILKSLESNLGGKRKLSDCSGQTDWPGKSVYFFFEKGENRKDTGSGLRVVRVGTSKNLQKRLRQHKGTDSGSGNHRISAFRLLVGSALIKRDNLNHRFWGLKKLKKKRLYIKMQSENVNEKEVKESENPLEQQVSGVMGQMSFLWLSVEDAPSPDSLRDYIERNSTSLLSNFDKEPLDAPSNEWLGRFCISKEDKVRKSGLWNRNYVDDPYEPEFLDKLDELISQTEEQ